MNFWEQAPRAVEARDLRRRGVQQAVERGATRPAKVGAYVHELSDQSARAVRQVAGLIAEADALLITAGAGMSADSGLPVFRGNEGFWRAYPPLRHLNISFERMAQPYWFAERPRMAWAWYGHRQQLYRMARPHAGYAILRKWTKVLTAGSFVVTSNVDGQFLAAGYSPDAVAEHHGSIHRLQCAKPCSDITWTASPTDLQINLETMEAGGQLPVCPVCGALARPNVLMFNDSKWVARFTQQQSQAFDRWLTGVRGRRLVILEIGAGTAIPTMRNLGERVAQRARANLVRINPDAPADMDGGIPLRLPAEQALRLIESALPEQFRNRYGTSRTSAATTPSASATLLSVPAREMDVIELGEAARSTQPPLARPTGPIRIRLEPLTDVDLATGQIEMVDPRDISNDEESACLDTWMAAQKEFVPLPSFCGPALQGYTMTARIVSRSGKPPDGPVGAALMLVCAPTGEVILTVGVGRNAEDGAFLWRILHQNAETPVQPLDYPRAPWLARVRDPAYIRYVAVLPELTAVVRCIAVSWLRIHAFLDQQQPGSS